MTPPLPPRRSLTTKQKLEVMLRYCRCPACGERFGALAEIQFDHIGQRSLTADDGLDNFRPLHIDCHKAKTARDAGDRAKMRKVKAREEEFRRRLLAKDAGEPIPTTGKRRAKIPSRPFPKRQKGLSR
jgi:5-methylcytosine-specific restriction enzyme A